MECSLLLFLHGERIPSAGTTRQTATLLVAAVGSVIRDEPERQEQPPENSAN